MRDAGRLSALSGIAAVAGLGETDYAADAEASRNGRVFDSYGLAATAFQRALTDAGLKRRDIDGLIVGAPLALERTGEVLGLDLGFAVQADAVNAVMQAVTAIHAGLAECIALVYGNNQRSAGTAYGGPQAMGGDRFLAYVQYAPWGLTSQGALYAMMASRYMAETGFTASDLGQIVSGIRAFARLNPQAIRRRALPVAEYLASPYVCEPLRRDDYCLINDGGVALIVTTAERARRLAQPLVTIAGFGRHDLNRDATSLRPRLVQRYHPAHAEAAAGLAEMSGTGPEDIGAVQIYDSFSVHIPVALEGFGFCPLGEAAGLVRSGALSPGGRLPVNSGGGMLGESYMQGWNHQIEAVRQLRGAAGPRQIDGLRHVQYLSDVAGKAATLLYRRGA
ncbi:thiolase family protein [Pararhodobacter aggregans]|uniref:Lipid-transfer protein n=1 Tax=Pararhodobacter aggregans TaxID=404875 RepID=A0A2T7UMR6_9RHOB|nr:thiolase family protein [Pararhodobacter aggregans]PTW99448.1 acetyl-CoA acetyltransferase [Pararhodobacter aggregans]PVE45982.1 lipid-transfer protein [Pararhodobacter aggregans]